MARQGGDEITWDDFTEEDWAAMDRANDAVGREERDPDSLGSLPDRVDAATDILGGLGITAEDLP
jgi:hypothetical protein